MQRGHLSSPSAVATHTAGRRAPDRTATQSGSAGNQAELEKLPATSLESDTPILDQAATEQPSSQAPPFVGPPAIDTHVVQPGDTLSLLAARYYGDLTLWPKIWEANFETIGDNPDLIEINWELFIPPLDVALNLQLETTEGMTLANQGGGMHYPDEAHPDGFLDPEYWEPLGSESPWNWHLKPGKSASEAVEAIFRGPSYLECSAALFATYARSILHTVGPQVFDREFGHAGEANQDLTIGDETYGTKLGDLVHKTGATSPEELQPGDGVYFENVPEYAAKHPLGYWQGENTVYLGDGRYSGFGEHDRTEEQLMDALTTEHNKPPTEAERQDPSFDPALEDHQTDPGQVPGIKWSTVIRLDSDAVGALT